MLKLISNECNIYYSSNYQTDPESEPLVLWEGGCELFQFTVTVAGLSVSVLVYPSLDNSVVIDPNFL